jgi:hypothetical protein
LCLYFLKPQVPSLKAQDSITQWATHAIQYGRLQEEGQQMRGELIQYLIGEIVDDEAVAPAKGLHKPAAIAVIAQGECGELEARDPALSAGLERHHVFVNEWQCHGLAEEAGSLAWREAEIGGAQLRHLVPGAQAREWERRVSACGDNHVQLGREVVKQEAHGLMNRPSVDQVVVVEHERRVERHHTQVVQERREDGLDRWRLRGRQQGQCGRATSRLECVQRRADVPPEAERIVIRAIHRDPGNVCGVRRAAWGLKIVGRRNPHAPSRKPLNEQCGLAEASRRSDQQQFAHQSRLHARDQAWACHSVRTCRGREELGSQQRRGGRGRLRGMRRYLYRCNRRLCGAGGGNVIWLVETSWRTARLHSKRRGSSIEPVERELG